MRRRRRRPWRPCAAAVLRGVVFFAAAVFAGAGVSPAAAVAALRVVVALAGAALVAAVFAAGGGLGGGAPWWRGPCAAVFAAGLAVVVRAAGGGGLLGRARRGGDTGGRRVHRHGDALVSESAQDDAAASGRHVSGAHGLGHLRAGHRAGRGTLADEGLQGLVRELRRECARLGGLVGHRRHRLPFVADGRTPRAREATVRKRRGRSCATPGRGAGWCSAGVVTRCASPL